MFCRMDEMTYTSGGATATQAILAALLPPYGWYKASTEIRDYRKKNPNTWLDTGLDAFVAGCEKSVTNAIYGIGCAYNFVAMNIATSGIGTAAGCLHHLQEVICPETPKIHCEGGFPMGSPLAFCFAAAKKAAAPFRCRRLWRKFMR